MLPQHEQEVNLGLPKFKLETSHELNPILWDLGIQKMFRAGERYNAVIVLFILFLFIFIN